MVKESNESFSLLYNFVSHQSIFSRFVLLSFAMTETNTHLFPTNQTHGSPESGEQLNIVSKNSQMVQLLPASIRLSRMKADRVLVYLLGWEAEFLSLITFNKWI
jgi:hypothetical protein